MKTTVHPRLAHTHITQVHAQPASMTSKHAHVHTDNHTRRAGTQDSMTHLLDLSDSSEVERDEVVVKLPDADVLILRGGDDARDIKINTEHALTVTSELVQPLAFLPVPHDHMAKPKRREGKWQMSVDHRQLEMTSCG